MKYDLFGRKVIEVTRMDEQWQVAYCGSGGIKRMANDIFIPAELAPEEIARYLADLFHEWARPGHADIIQLA